VRLTPPLVITDEEIQKALDIIKEALEELPVHKGEKEDEASTPSGKGARVPVGS
jgi:ornithine--oxo-acid transaminase